MEAQLAAIDKVRSGNHWNQPHEAAVRAVTSGLVKLGLLKGRVPELIKTQAYTTYFGHRTGHWLGMDVHDVGDYKVGGEWRVLEPGMALTVEPGIYIRPSPRVPKEFWNIGIRIEDDVLVTAEAPEVLTLALEKTPDCHRSDDAMTQALDRSTDAMARPFDPSADAMMRPFDIAIVGGGMVGASLGVALAPLGLRVALIEAIPHDSAAQPSFDERTTALSNGSRRILETLGVWPGVQSLATPIRRIHVSDQGRFGFARIDAAEQGLAAMGYVVPNRALGSALWPRLQAGANISVFCPAEVSNITAGSNEVMLDIAGPDGSATIKTRLIVAADGVQSAVRRAFWGRGRDPRLPTDGRHHHRAPATLS